MNKTAQQRAEELLSKMTVREKVGQLNQCGNSIYNDDYKVGWDLLREGRIGSFLGINDVESANELQRVAVEETRLGIPLLLGFDVIHGYRTVFPVPWAESASWEPALAKKTSEASTAEAAANGVDWIYGPMVDISRDPRWGRGVEGAGEDVYLSSEFARARVQGIQGDDISDGKHLAACAKHFVGYGACIGGRDYNSAEMSEQTLRDVYLPPFKAAIDAGVKSIMTAFHDLNGEPCTGSKYLLRDVLRDEMGFTGVTISDAGSTDQLLIHGYTESHRDTAKTAITAGLDVEMCFGIFTFQDNLEDLVNEGIVPMETLDEAVKRVLTLKFELGLFENPYRDTEKAKEAILTKENRDLAYEVAKRSVVLLKNNGVLPISEDSRIALVGPFADNGGEMIGAWSGLGKGSEAVTPVMAFGDKAEFAKGCGSLDDSENDFEGAKAVALKNDVVIAFIGESSSLNGEGKSRTRNTIPDSHIELIRQLKETGKKVVAVVIAGRPVVLTEVSELADAVLFSGALGTEAGRAYKDIIYGRYNPSAKLINTMPTVVGQAPIFYSMRNTGKPPVEEFFWTSKYIDAPIKPLYPFGYGLSYTNFEYSNIRVSKDKVTENDKITVTVDVKNAGNYDGEEVVELYVKDVTASQTRPMKELKGFKKVFIKKGETETVSIELDIKNIGFYTRKLDYIVEKGKFIVMMGTSSDSVLETSITVE